MRIVLRCDGMLDCRRWWHILRIFVNRNVIELLHYLNMVDAKGKIFLIRMLPMTSDSLISSTEAIE